MFTQYSIQSSECEVWFDGASKKRKRDFEGEQISKHIKTLADRKHIETKRSETLHSDLQEASGVSSDAKIAEVEQSNLEETSISFFKRIRFDTGLQTLAIEELAMLIQLNRDQVSCSDLQIREYSCSLCQIRAHSVQVGKTRGIPKRCC